MAIQRLLRGSSGLLKGFLVARYPQRAAADRNFCTHTQVLWSPSMQEHAPISPYWALQSKIHCGRNAGYMTSFTLLPIRAMHFLTPAAQISNFCEAHERHDLPACEDDEICTDFCEAHDQPTCKDVEIPEADAAFQRYIEKTANVDPSVAAAVVDHAPSFRKQLVAVIKKEVKGEEDTVTGELGFKQVCEFLDSVGINILEPVLESIGIPCEYLQKLLVRLSVEDVDLQSLFFLINTLEKLGVLRSSIGSIISKDLQVLSYSSEEIEVGICTLKGLEVSQDSLLSLAQRYPLIFKAEVINNIAYLQEELAEFTSKDLILRKAVCDHPQRVHTYSRGCATEVVGYLKSFDFKVARLDRILQKHARLVLTDVEKKLKPNVQFLEDLGLTKDMIHKVINRCPNFLFYSVDDNLMAKLEYFKGLGFDETEFCQIIWRFPNLFSASMERKIKPAIAELRTLGLSDQGLKKIVLYRPCLFGYRLGGDISALVKQLSEGKFPEDKKVTAFIKLYSRGTEHKKSCEDCLVQHGLSIEEAKEVLEKEPGILGYNEHALREKLQSLTNTFGIPIRNVLDVPEYLSFGLRKRVQRRQRVLSYMKSKGLLTGALNLKQLVLHSNTHFYNDFVKSHSEDKELFKIWFKDRDSASSLGNYSIRSSLSEGSPEAEGSP